MMRTAVVLALLASLVFAGCLDDAAPAPDAMAGNRFVTRLAAGVPPINVSISEGVDWWETFVTTYPARVSYTPINQQATDFIAAGLRERGLDVTVELVPAGAVVANAPDGTPGLVHVVVGKKLGLTDPDHAILLGGHYDHYAITDPNNLPGATQAMLGDPTSLMGGALQAAYDNGSGTAVVMATCEALAKLPLDKTLLCVLFDGEEFGLVGSQGYLAAGADGITLDAYLGFDMTGINWPGVDPTTPQWAEWKLYTFVGAEFAEAVHPFVNATVHDILGFPESGAEVLPTDGGRSSDEASFASAHIPAIRFAGGRSAGIYPRYHQVQDSVDFVYEFMGGRAAFEAGFGAIVEEAYTLAAMLDKTSLEELAAQPT